MMVIALLAAAASPQLQTHRAGAVHQATATVRMLPAARIESGSISDTALVRKITVRRDDGSEAIERLIEFP